MEVSISDTPDIVMLIFGKSIQTAEGKPLPFGWPYRSCGWNLMQLATSEVKLKINKKVPVFPLLNRKNWMDTQNDSDPDVFHDRSRDGNHRVRSVKSQNQVT